MNEHKELVKPLTGDITPYKIAKYLKVNYGIVVASQRFYRDVQEGRLAAYRVGDPKTGKWFVKKDDATKFILDYLNGSKTNNSDPW